MLASLLPSTAVGQALLLAALAIAALVLVDIWHRRAGAHNRRLSTALDNMSQGLCMFDAQGRIVLRNRRYIEMYKLSPQIVRPGCSLRALIQHRKDTGLFSGDVDSLLPEHYGGSGQRQQCAVLRAIKRRPRRAGQERAAAERRLGVHP